MSSRARRPSQGRPWRLLAVKAWRDVTHMRGQMLAIVTVIGLGVATFVSLRGMAEYLTASQYGYYASARFAHAFAQVMAAPLEVADQVRRIPGVSAADGRVVADVVARVPGLSEPATVRLVSVPATGQPRLNALVLRSGRWPDVAQRAEVLASEAFATANGLRESDVVQAVLDGRAETLRIVGTALSPEFIYEIPAGASVLPDNRRFGVLWMPYDVLADAFELRDVSMIWPCPTRRERMNGRSCRHWIACLRRMGLVARSGARIRSRIVSSVMRSNRIARARSSCR